MLLPGPGTYGGPKAQAADEDAVLDNEEDESAILSKLTDEKAASYGMGETTDPKLLADEESSSDSGSDSLSNDSLSDKEAVEL